ncbi:MAG: hypothetical protein E6G68_07805, partial [Actinobacteria bacterium]
MSDPAMLHYRIDAGDPEATQITFFDPAGKAVHVLRTADAKSGEIVRRAITQDLLRMDVDAFRAKYGIRDGAGPVGSAAETPNPAGAWRVYRMDRRKVTVTKGGGLASKLALKLGAQTKTVRRKLTLEEAQRMGVPLPPDIADL